MAVAHGFSSVLLEVVPRNQKIDLLPVTLGEMLDGVKTYAANVAL
jgi:hypothetical protein